MPHVFTPVYAPRAPFSRPNSDMQIPPHFGFQTRTAVRQRKAEWKMSQAHGNAAESVQSRSGGEQTLPDAQERLQRAAAILARAAIRACLAEVGQEKEGDAGNEH